MRALRIHAQAGPGALVVEAAPYPHTAENDVVVRVHAAGFTPGELDWPSTWKDRAGRDRSPVIPGHEVSGEVAELGMGTTGLTVGQRVFGLTDWARDGTLAEYVAVEARNLAPLPASIDYTCGAALPMPGLTAWQALFDHAGMRPGKTVRTWRCSSRGRPGPASSAPAGSGTARPCWRPVPNASPSSTRSGSRRWPGRWTWCWTRSAGTCLTVQRQWSGPGGTLVSVAAPPKARPTDGRAVFFVVEPNRDQLAELARRVQQGRLTPKVGAVRPLAEARDAFLTKQAT